MKKMKKIITNSQQKRIYTVNLNPTIEKVLIVHTVAHPKISAVVGNGGGGEHSRDAKVS